MRNVMLSWDQAVVLTGALAVVATGLSVARDRRVQRIAPFAREITLVTGLYALWQIAGHLSKGDANTGPAFARARWIEHAERFVHLPSEVHVQKIVTADSLVAQSANLYYATMHFTGLGLFLVWLFVRHRDRYRPVRRVLALTTLVCLLIQLVPVAPPRLLPELGFTDTAAKFGQSVYSNGFVPDQLSAMPSVHVAWAVLIGWAVWRIGRGPWRWIGPAHAVITVVVVVATANHFWADGIVAVAALCVCAGIERAGRQLVSTLLDRWRTAPADAPPPVPTGDVGLATSAGTVAPPT